MQIPENMIIRSIQQTASEEELETLSKWLKQSEKNLSFYLQLDELLSSRKKLPEETINQGWQRLAGKIEQQATSQPAKNIKRTIKWWRYVAAIFIGGLIASTFWMAIDKLGNEQNSIVQNVIYNKTGVHSVVLPDGSEVWLNENSKLVFLEDFSDHKRRATLEGKGYFDIRSNKENPFWVETNGATIEVVGTQFFVESTSNEESTVTLISGSINLNYTNRIGETVSTSLTPSQQAHINHNEASVIINNVNTDYYVAWKDGTYRFTNERFETIATILAHHFDLDIYIAPSLKEKRFTGRVLSDQSVRDILQIFEKSYAIKYLISETETRVFE